MGRQTSPLRLSLHALVSDKLMSGPIAEWGKYALHHELIA